MVLTNYTPLPRRIQNLQAYEKEIENLVHNHGTLAQH